MEPFFQKVGGNSILQYWFYEINIKILAVNQQKWGSGFVH